MLRIPNLRPRERLLLPLIKTRDVLDIGSVGQSAGHRLWPFLDAHSASLSGVDLPEAQERHMALFGLEAEHFTHAKDSRLSWGNFESLQLERTFQVIVAGDVIEHVYNPGMFLHNCRKHLETDGRLVITTPNAKWPTVFIRPNPTHVCWHDRHTLEHLLTAHGFWLESITYYPGNRPRYAPWTQAIGWRQQLFVVARKE